MGTPTEGRERASSSPNSRGGSEHWLRSKDSLAGTLSTEVGLRDAAKGVECDMGGGGRGRHSGVCTRLRLRMAGWHWSRAIALLCGHRSYCHAHMNVRACWYCCAHHRSLYIVESICRVSLNHVGCPPSWTCHVPHRDSYCDPYH